MTTEQFIHQDLPTVRSNVMVIGNSDRMVRVLDAADRAAASDAKVLVTGESGAGKDLVVRRIHAHSARAGQPFVPINCAAFSEAQLESELFGHVNGGFGGVSMPGLLQAAHRGTVLLDGVGEVSLRLQAKLLRFIETGEVPSAGAIGGGRVDVRMIAAASDNLVERVAAGRFREDLLYRLRVIHLEVPPLRKRRDDVAPLVMHFIGRIRPGVTVTPHAMRMLVRYRWPGNVRELQNVVEQAAWVATTGDVIDVEHLPPAVRLAADSVLQTSDRRASVSDELYDGLVEAGYSFWDHVYPLFLSRDITRHDIRALVRRGLATTRGNYRGLLRLFGMPPEDYKRFLNFLAAHQCGVDFREFRKGVGEVLRQARVVPGALTASANVEDDAFARN